MAHSRKKRKIGDRMEILHNCDRSTIERVLPLFLTFIWDVEQYMRTCDSFLMYAKEGETRKNKVLDHIETFHEMFRDK